MTAIPEEPDWLRNWKAAPPPADPKRASGGTFAPGVSGNPQGMKPGTKHRRTLLAEQFDEGIEQIVAVVKARALEGDLQAAGLVLARAVPPKRAVSERTPFELDTSKPASDQATQILKAMADGDLPVDVGHTVLACLTARVALQQAETLEDRLAALERGQHLTGTPSGIKFIPMEPQQP